jgi:peptidoglycan-associated lipoprotein
MIKGYFMTYKLWVLSAVASVMFEGCAQTAPSLNSSNISDANAITGDTVSINETNYGNGYNSSSDGFKSIYFNFGEYTISSKMETNMQSNIQVANTIGAKIKIEGNCDEFGTDEYNYALGLKRAKAVKDAMVAQGIVASKMVMVSFGESSPVCTEPSDGCYDRNRRVDIRLIR